MHLTTFLGRMTMRVTATLMVLLGIAAPSTAADLFRASTDDLPAPTALVADLPPGALIAARVVVVDPSTLTAAGNSEPAPRLSMPLADGLRPDFRREAVEASVGLTVWTGAAAAGGETILVFRGAQVTGFIKAGGRTFRLDPLAGSRHLLREIDPSRMSGDLVAFPPTRSRAFTPPAPRSDAGEAAPPSAAATVVTLLGVYSRAAGKILGDAEAKIVLDVAITNKVLKNSRVPIKIRLLAVDAAARSYSEKGGSPVKPLNDITAGKGALKAIHRRRDSLKADLVTFYADRREYCGVAWMNEQPNANAASYGYSVINPVCAGSSVLAHELGHNMGLRHDRYVEGKFPASQYNFGFVSIPGRFLDVMAYTDECQDRKVACNYLLYFSNPRLRYKGRAIGIPAGRTGAADASRALTENRKVIAGFR